jgi:hypothetical protein
VAGILRREADEAYDTAEKLKEGPLAMSKDHEWDEFVTSNSQMIDPRNPVRQLAHITYPGKDHPAAIEVRSGMLERKSKYLKNYTPGWYGFSFYFIVVTLTSAQVHFVTDALARIQIGRSYHVSISSHVVISPGTEAGHSFRARIIFAQIHAQRSTNRFYAPWTCMGL